MSEFTHFDAAGAASMVDVGEKPVTRRTATAQASVHADAATIEAIRRGTASKKGDVLAVARLAGIAAAKKTWDLIPLCHVLPLDAVEVTFEWPADGSLRIVATARVTACTGVEMEAMTAASVAALTVYDMCKAVDRGMRIEAVRLLSKSGGRSGDWSAGDQAAAEGAVGEA